VLGAIRPASIVILHPERVINVVCRRYFWTSIAVLDAILFRPR
jgi:hypothetical protein